MALTKGSTQEPVALGAEELRQQEAKQLEMLAEALLVIEGAGGLVAMSARGLEKRLRLLLMIAYPQSCSDAAEDVNSHGMASRPMPSNGRHLHQGAIKLAAACVKSISAKAKKQGRAHGNGLRMMITPDYSLPMADLPATPGLYGYLRGRSSWHMMDEEEQAWQEQLRQELRQEIRSEETGEH